jgi:hypothetical protein
MEVAILNAGMRQAFRALSWSLDWETVRAAEGDEPSAEQVAAWWNQSKRTAYRNQAAFREAFPSLDTPAAIFSDPRAKDAIQAVADALKERSALKKARALERATAMVGQLPAM